MRQYRNQLKEKIEKFWMEKALHDEEDIKRTLKIRALAKRGFGKIVKKYYESECKSWDGYHIIDFADMRFIFETEQILNQINVKQTFLKENLIGLVKNFNSYTEAMYLKLACVLWTYSNILKVDYSSEIVEFVSDYLSQKGLEPKDGLSYVFLVVLKFLKNESDQVTEILQLVEKDNAKLNPNEILEIGQLVQNGIIHRQNKGQFQDWAPQLMQLYDWRLREGFLIQNGIIDPREYKNMIVTSLRLGQDEVAKAYLEDLKIYLPKNESEYYRFCLGYFYYKTAQKDKIKSLEAWHPTQSFKNTILHISYTIHLQEIKYEESWTGHPNPEIDHIIGVLNNLKRWAFKPNKDISEAKKETYRRQINIFLKLLKQMDKNKLLKLKKEIIEHSKLANKSWFLLQLEKRIKQG
ncbi:MAG: hypothetical protein MRZ79_04065 [Bacteroidia bacterium]|nr:hypothetical protein [Bacteroidia bacterium]